MTAWTTINPADGQAIQKYETMGPEELETVLAQADRAFTQWRQTPLKARSDRVGALREQLLRQKEGLARLITEEMGKPISQSRSEIEKCARGCQYYVDHGEDFLRSRLIPIEALRSMVVFRPLGLILAIMPWNYPLWQVFRAAIPALMAGNGLLLKHAPNVAGCALALERLWLEAGFPPGLFRSLIADIPQTTSLIRDRRIAAVTLTGSVRAGRAVAAEAGKALKKCVLELGGSDPFIILEDADLDHAVEVGVQSRFLNSGQSCIAAKRFIVVASRCAEFEKKLLERTAKMKMGSPLEEDVFLGPMARSDLRDALHRQVRDSVRRGGRLLTGGEIPKGPGFYYPPTVLTEVAAGMPAFSEELFGPVAAVLPVRDEIEALATANATDFGLGSSLWTRDLAKGERLALEIEAGGCFVNSMMRSDPRLPFGGIKNSGYGRELSSFGIHEFVNVQTVVVDNK